MERDVGPLLAAAEAWKAKCLISDGSVLSEDSLWTTHLLDQLEQHFVQNLDEGEGNFETKLEKQLSAATPQARKLAAEMTWVMLLCPSNIGTARKRRSIQQVWEWSGDSLPANSPMLSDQVLLGVGSAGTAYNLQRWRELVFFITLVRGLKALDVQKRKETLSSSEQLTTFIDSFAAFNGRQLRYMLLFLLFPDANERIFGGGDRRAIVSVLGGLTRKQVAGLSQAQIDDRLRGIRAEESAKRGIRDFDFYLPDVIADWRPSSLREGPESSEDASLTEQQSVDLSDVLKRFLAQAKAGTELSTKAFAGTYEGLRLKVSFGKGNFARIPWIALLSGDDTVPFGIYPVILYYRDADALLVCYGVSEERQPERQWIGTDAKETVQEYFLKAHGRTPDRYAASRVERAFSSTTNISTADVQAALDAVVDRYVTTASSISEPEPTLGYDSVSTPYSIEEALDGLFIDRAEFARWQRTLSAKRNIILQGPPGVGKTFVAKRLAYAQMKAADKDRVTTVQFHQSYSYEDFVQGYRPSAGGFTLKNGVFFDFCKRASRRQSEPHFFIIDEINRGNLSKVFGELMLLVEADKRGEEWAMPLTYSTGASDTFYVPDNVYIIGLMNTADRSLALVDYALRRRFAFIDVVPAFEQDQFKEFLAEHSEDTDLPTRIVSDMKALNDAIENDRNLGRGFCIGHSYFCNLASTEVVGADWYQQIVESELLPLLSEYWFDDNEQLRKWKQRLLP